MNSPVVNISCLDADFFFPAAEDRSVAAGPRAGLLLSSLTGLPGVEWEWDLPPFVLAAPYPLASDGEILVGVAWADGRRFEISCS